MREWIRAALCACAGVASAPAGPSQAPAEPAPGTAVEVELEAIPFPDLAPLEGAVAAQLEQARALLESLLLEESSAAVAGATARAAGIHGDLGRLYQAYGFDEAAGAAFRNAAALDRAAFAWPYHLAYLHQEAGRWEEALAAYERALGIDPEHVPALYHLAEACLALDRPEAAEEALRRASGLAPDEPAVLAQLGELALSAGRHREAIDLLEAARKGAPAANRLCYPLAMAHRALGDVDRARELLARSGQVGVRVRDPLVDGLEELTRGERVHLLEGRLAYSAGRHREAADAFRKAVDARPESARARVNLGSALVQLGDLAGALEQFREALELEPENATAHFNVGSLMARAGDLARAAEHYGAAVRIEPRDHQAHFELGEVLSRAGRSEEALARYARALELEPLAALAWLGTARLLVDAARHADALDALEQAHGLLPEDGRIAHALARVLAACPRTELRDGERALDLALRVHRAWATPSHAETVAMALAQLERCDEAARWQREAIAALGEGTEPERLRRMQETLRRYGELRPCRPPGERGAEDPENER